MLRRRLALLLIGIVPALTACPAQPAPAAPAGTPATVPTGPTPTTAAPPATPTSWTSSMLASVNAERARVGAAPLSLCNALSRAAQAHSADQAATSNMTHTGSDGSTLGTRADRAGYRNWTTLGENVAYGYSNPTAVMTGWMNSPGHKANILNTSYTHVGFGRADSGSGVPYWTQDFGRSGTC